MDFLHYNYLIRITTIFVFIYVGSWLKLSSQNPFDIKPPVNKSETSQPKVQEKSNPSDPVKQEQTREKLPAQASESTNSKSKSENIFEIKTASKPKEIAPVIPDHSVNPGISSQINKDTLSTRNQIPGLSASTGKLKDTSNPFNIVPPEQNSSSPAVISASPSTTKADQNTPDLKQLENNIEKFKNSTLQEQGVISKNAWFMIYIFLFLLAAVAINFNRAYPIALIRATYNQNQLRILFKDAFKGNQVMIFSILYLLFIINGGIFLYLSFKIFDVGHISLFLAIGLILLVYLIRHLVLYVLGFTFPLTKETMLFSYTVGLHNLALGLALMLINILLSFVDAETGKALIFSGLAIILMMYLLRQVRGLLNNMPLIISSKFHFIIYLCTVEIAPWLLLTGILLR